MWNFGATYFWPDTSPTPSPTCTNTATSAKAVNHHRARLRSPASQLAPSAHAPAMPLPMITNQAHPLWMSSSSCAYRFRRALVRPGADLDLRFLVRLGGDVHELGDLVVREAGQPPEVAGQMHWILVALAAEPAEAEQLVD